MSDSINNIENKKQNHQKPPLSAGRIACEILAAVMTGFAIPVPLSYAVLYMFTCMFFGAPADWPEKGEFGPFVFFALTIIILSFLVLYGPATAFGVYLVGRIGKQTGSLLATFGGVFLGVPIIILLYLYIDMAGDMMLGIVKIFLWTLVILAAPIGATLCFNLTRRYKEPQSALHISRDTIDDI
jgi:hypothetical protein